MVELYGKINVFLVNLWIAKFKHTTMVHRGSHLHVGESKRIGETTVVRLQDYWFTFIDVEIFPTLDSAERQTSQLK